MKHVIIGIAQTGAEALSHVYPLFYKAHQDSINRDVGFFYIHNRAQGKNDLKFIIPQHSYSLPDGAGSETIEKVRDHLHKHLPKCTDIDTFGDKEIKNSLYYFLQRFQDNGEEFWQSINAFCMEAKNQDDIERFHIILDAADPFSVGIALKVFEQLNIRYPQSVISVYIFYPSSEKVLSENNAAVLAAFLLRLSELRSDDFRPYVFSFKSNAQQMSHYMACGKQIFTSIYLAPVSLGTEKIKKTHKKSQFSQIKELILHVDQDKIRNSLSKQIVSLLLNRLISSSKNNTPAKSQTKTEKKNDFIQMLSLMGDNSKSLDNMESMVIAPQEKEFESIYPQWTNQLFSDKKWLLHPDYLTMEQEVFPRPDATDMLHNMADEWKECTDLALATSADIRKWDERFESIQNSLQLFYEKDFREQGASSFYTVNDRNLDAVAKLITAQIEEELVMGWQRDEYEIIDIPNILDKIIRLLNARLALCRGLFEEHAYNAENALSEFQAMLENWREGTRTEKRQLEKIDSRDIAKIIMRHYVNLCQHKAMNFANKLLWTIIEEMNVLQEQLKLVLVETKAYIRSQSTADTEIGCQINLSVTNEQEWVVFANADFISLMPESFSKQTDSVFEVVRDDFASQVRAKKGLTALLKFLQDINLIEGLKRLVLLEHPIFHTSRLNSLNNLVFWQTIPNFLISPPENFNRELHTFSAIDDTQKDIESVGLWLVPSAPMEREDLDSLINTLRTYSPSSHVLINVKMTDPYLIFRNISGYALPSLPGFSSICSSYEKTLSGNKGIINALLLHPENKEPYPSRLNELLHLPSADNIRRTLLLGEIYGVIKEREDDMGTPEIYTEMHNKPIILGSSFLDVLKNMDATQFKYLSNAIESVDQQEVTAHHHTILQNRLEKIKLHCLNGKTDIRKADWKEAGLYMPWSRAAERVLPGTQIKETKTAQQSSGNPDE